MDKKPLQKERDNRSAEKKDLTFHPFTITPESAYTSVLLLQSDEPEVLCQTLRAMTKFSAQDTANRHVLFNLNAINYILPHIENPEMNIKRFALKALAQLCQLPRGPEQVLQNPQNLRKIAFLLPKMEDVYVLEFASLVLSELTKEPLGCEQLVSANILSSLFSRMKNSLDPDVQKNCLQTLSNLLDDPVCASEVTKNQQFSWPSLLALMQSKYLAIQHAALRTVDQLISRHQDHTVQKTFRASTGVLDLCDILESYEFRDVHAMVLGVLRNYVQTEENAAHVYQSGCIIRLLTYLEMALPPMKSHCLAVLTKMSFVTNGRDALFETGTDLVFCHQLLSSNVELLADAAMGVANMTKLLPSAVRMSDTNIIEALCSILSDDVAAWFYIRMNALRALAELCRIIPKASYSLVEPKTFASLRNINKKFKENPIEAQRLAVQCYLNLQTYHNGIKAMLNADFMLELINIMTRIDISLKIMVCAVITGLMVEDVAKGLFSEKKGEDAVSSNLKIEHVGLRTALCTLIAASVTDDGANAYLELGTIHYMVENKKARYVVSAWEAAIEAIFRHQPSAKFAYTGRLDINDFTQEGFYVQKRLGAKFCSLKEIMAQKPPYTNPTYIVKFHQPPFKDNESEIGVRTPYSEVSTHAPNSSTGRVSPFSDDPNLRSYLHKWRVWFGDPAKSLQYIEIDDAHYEVKYRDRCNEVSASLKHRAQMLAEFVAQQMSGLDQERDCSMPQVSLHVNDLMRELGTPVVGLGLVRCGGALERALLYKTLADRAGVPCGLQRTAGHACCQLAVPELSQEEESEGPENYPAGLLRVNYVVDLTIKPGRLLPIGSAEAKQVCGPQCLPKYHAASLPEVCRCERVPRR